VILFLQVCLWCFAGCAVLGLLPAFVLAARAGQPRLVLYASAAAAFVIWVLVSAAGDLR
jgi:hypothetical protein